MRQRAHAPILSYRISPAISISTSAGSDQGLARAAMQMSCDAEAHHMQYFVAIYITMLITLSLHPSLVEHEIALRRYLGVKSSACSDRLPDDKT